MSRRGFVAVALAFVVLVGCSDQKRIPKKTPIELKEVPESVMKVAKEKMPDVKFDRAWKNDEGVYEIAGKTKSGKVVEIDIKPDGTVVEIENYP